MGARFEARFANIIGYLTEPNIRSSPRLDEGLLGYFLQAFAGARSLHQSIGHGEAGMRIDDYVGNEGRFESKFEEHFEANAPAQLISFDRWSTNLNYVARKQLDLLNHRLGPSLLESEEVEYFLNPLKPFFGPYPLYAMIFSNQSGKGDDYLAQDFFERTARETRDLGLIFKPETYTNFLDFVDPFPCVQALAEQPTPFPAVVFWTKGNNAIAVSIGRAYALFREVILPELLEGRGKNLPTIFNEFRQKQRSKRILHLSDLHFGKPEAAVRRRYLKNHLAQICKDVDRVVVTGDLFDNPRADLRREFDEFRADVERFTRLPMLVVPGNHDVRMFGFLGRSFKHVTSLWNPLEIDEDLRTVFFCFNSCERGNWARGWVTEQQRLNIAAAYQEALARKSYIESYTKIALVHHHPLAFENEPEPETLYQKLIQQIWAPDAFLQFVNADDFNTWCIKRGVSLILHGHKHFPRQSRLGDRALVVGCGSTTGVESTPMCYDIVTLGESSAGWSVTFYMDEHGDGGGFEVQAVSLPS